MFWKSVKIWGNYRYKADGAFFETQRKNNNMHILPRQKVVTSWPLLLFVSWTLWTIRCYW